MRNKILILLILIVFSSLVNSFSLSDQGTGVRNSSSGELVDGDLRVVIYNQSVGGGVLFDEVFSGVVVNGSWNVMLTNLNLNFNQEYFKDYYINNENVNFTNSSGGISDRMSFFSPLGNVSSEEIVDEINFTRINFIDVFFDNLVSSWLRLSGNLNVTGSVVSSGQNVCLEDGTNCPAGLSGDITSVNTDGDYLSGGVLSGDVNLYLNESRLNETIDARSGGSDVNWSDVTNRPSGLDDGDNDTTYSDLNEFTNTPGYITNSTMNKSVLWSNLINVPSGLDDGDNDSFLTQTCSDMQILKWNISFGGWACTSDLTSTGNGTEDIDSVETNGKYLTGGQISGPVALSLVESELNNTILSLEIDTFWSLALGYLFNNSGNLDFNESKLNLTIDARVPNSLSEFSNDLGYVTNLTMNKSVNWSNIDNIPVDIVDGDDDTTYNNLSEFVDDINAGNYWINYSGNLTFVNGNVGIGTTSPSSKLHVNGTINASSFVGNGENITNIKSKVILNGQTGAFLRKIQASDPEASDYFGRSVGISGDRIVVGAYAEDPGGLSSAGSAYIYDSNGNFLNKITANDSEVIDEFGYSVGISGDRIVVGAYSEDPEGLSNAGSAYIYDSDGNFIQKIQASDPEADDRFGYSVVISGDRIVVGANGEDTTASNAGSVYIYDSNGNFIQKIQASDPEASDYFGRSVGISGDRIVVGANGEDTTASDAGSAYIYDSDGNFIQKIQASDPEASDYFGYSVGISGDRIVVGAHFEDPEGLSNAGSAYIYDSDGNFIQKIQASDPEADDRFGYSVAISGDRIVVGAYVEDPEGLSNAGSAYIYDSDGNFIQKIQASDPEASDYFGYSVGISGDRIVVGAYAEDTTASGAGSAYIYHNVAEDVIDIMKAWFGKD